ncbi:acyl-ACP--UDP-N-acetylglucosamine O-acyltransferase [Limibacter armeniacum]|uniref:acyl-ACP--UDP-N-acetylglucosamine O-acyltransferase n=1 Tax=Limibacter armeniacum TaxID=466084 RepID=UPI002FE54BE2
MDYPLTNIHPDAKIGEGVVIEPFTTIRGNVEIGEGSWIGPNVTIMEGARIGKNCKIFPGAVISAVPQDLKFEGEDTTVVIGDNTIIRECVTINRGTSDKWETRIGNNCLLMAYVHIAHDCQIGDYCIFSNGVQMAGHVEVGDNVVVGGTTAIHQFVKIGTHAFVAGGSLVSKDVPPFIKAGREPLRYCGINSVGLKRRGFDNDTIHEIHEIYRNLYNKGVNLSVAVKMVEEEMAQTDAREEVLTFLKNSDRGVVKGY